MKLTSKTDICNASVKLNLLDFFSPKEKNTGNKSRIECHVHFNRFVLHRFIVILFVVLLFIFLKFHHTIFISP